MAVEDQYVSMMSLGTTVYGNDINYSNNISTNKQQSVQYSSIIDLCLSARRCYITHVVVKKAFSHKGMDIAEGEILKLLDSVAEDSVVGGINVQVSSTGASTYLPCYVEGDFVEYKSTDMSNTVETTGFKYGDYLNCDDVHNPDLAVENSTLDVEYDCDNDYEYTYCHLRPNLRNSKERKVDYLAGDPNSYTNTNERVTYTRSNNDNTDAYVDMDLSYFKGDLRECNNTDTSKNVETTGFTYGDYLNCNDGRNPDLAVQNSTLDVEYDCDDDYEYAYCHFRQNLKNPKERKVSYLAGELNLYTNKQSMYTTRNDNDVDAIYVDMDLSSFISKPLLPGKETMKYENTIYEEMSKFTRVCII